MHKLLTVNAALKSAAAVISVVTAIAGPVWAAQTERTSSAAEQRFAVPIFSPNGNVGWMSYGPNFLPAPSGPHPVTFDPAHPFVENAIEYNAARPGTKDENQQSTFPVADLSIQARSMRLGTRYSAILVSSASGWAK